MDTDLENVQTVFWIEVGKFIATQKYVKLISTTAATFPSLFKKIIALFAAQHAVNVSQPEVHF